MRTNIKRKAKKHLKRYAKSKDGNCNPSIRDTTFFPNEEEWKLEVRPGSQNTSSSVTWSHAMEPNTPLVILTKMGIGIMNEIPIKGLQRTQPEVLGNLRPISAGSRVSHRYGIYGVVDSNKHPFLIQAVEDRLLSYQGGIYLHASQSVGNST